MSLNHGCPDFYPLDRSQNRIGSEFVDKCKFTALVDHSEQTESILWSTYDLRALKLSICANIHEMS